MAKTDITLTRAAADQIQTTLGKARQAIRQINPTLAQQLNECVKALGPETPVNPQAPTAEFRDPYPAASEKRANTLSAADIGGSDPGEAGEPEPEESTKTESQSD